MIFNGASSNPTGSFVIFSSSGGGWNTNGVGGDLNFDNTPVLLEEQLIPSLSLAYSTFNSRPGISADGQPYWVGGFSSTPGGPTENRALFLGVGATSVLKGGDSIGN